MELSETGDAAERETKYPACSPSLPFAPFSPPFQWRWRDWVQS